MQAYDVTMITAGHPATDGDAFYLTRQFMRGVQGSGSPDVWARALMFLRGYESPP